MNTTMHKVRGRGVFPIDMLRYDQAFPATEQDSGLIEDSHRAGGGRGGTERTIMVATFVTRDLTAGRWESFGWKVVE